MKTISICLDIQGCLQDSGLGGEVQNWVLILWVWIYHIHNQVGGCRVHSCKILKVCTQID